ncbi:hypothetical protein [Streptomyces sp. NPDC092295]|uniref:hypothetical protein n=1 Tax=Streptomyces sp. NPDC092295 TaxID=3366011 RepID=UPI00382C8018
MKLQVTACDIDKAVPAQTYTITTEDGRTATADLCGAHAEPIEALFADFGGESPATDVTVETEPERERRAPARKTAARKTTTKKAATKKAATKKVTARRRPKITSLEEIEASKNKT